MRVKLLLCLCLIFPALALEAFAEDFSIPRMIRVSLLEGDVTFQRPDLERWVDLSINTPLLEGDKIWVGRDGRAEIEFEDGNFARLAANTIIELYRLGSARDSQGIEIRLNQGLATFDLRSVHPKFAVATPLFSAQVKEAAQFRFDLEGDGSGRIVMFDGRAEISGQNTQLYLGKGETVRFLSQDTGRYYLGTNYVKDDWDRWSEERSAYIAQAAQERLHYGDRGWTTADLYNYGTWYNDTTYGRVWRPNVAYDWVPFRDGRWTWFPSFGWSWISYEPWGWVPYHYGRWAYINRFGWSWVPGARYTPWCPGAVNWLQGSNWIGWVPLAPFEPWYPYAYNSVNVFVSRNFGHRFGVTYWHRDHFLNGTPVRDFRTPRDPYADGRIIAGQPRVTPTPASRMPVVGNSAVRTFRNEDLEARRNMRERLSNGAVTAPASVPSASGFDQLRQQRSQAGTQGVSSFDSSNSGVRTIQGGSGTGSDYDRARVYDNWGGGRNSVRSEQRQRIYRIDGSNTGTPTQRPSPSTWAQPTSLVRPLPSNNPPGVPATGLSDRTDSRQRLYEVYRNRNAAGADDRYAPRSIQREAPTYRFSPNTTPAPPPRVMNPQGPTPSYTGPSVRPVGPPPGYSAPISSRGAMTQSQSSRAGAGASNSEGRSAVRGRMGR
jgi:hypothetical protein